MVPFDGSKLILLPCTVSKLQRLALSSAMRRRATFRRGLFANHNCRTNGMVPPQAGLTHFTVLAQKKATGCLPSLEGGNSGSITFWTFVSIQWPQYFTSAAKGFFRYSASVIAMSRTQ